MRAGVPGFSPSRRLFLLASAAALTGCASKFPVYRGPEVTRLEVHKAQRRLLLFSGDSVLRAYRIDLGFAPVGHKQVDGDGRTPEGAYVIDRRNPDSTYYLSIGISYPNAADVAYALAQGLDPGGDIFIHGGPRPGIDPAGPDWTAGCIAVTDDEIREIYAMVRDGTPIDIYA
jgi:murein L,D-transpeptidase YafK